jgi:hypothetical protein
MNTNAIARHYDKLTPEERFRLIVAAGARGDVAEQDRLKSAGDRITLSFRDHFPYSMAFEELVMLTYMELLDDAAVYHEALQRLDEVDDLFEGEEADKYREQQHDLAFAAGYVLRTKAEGWKLFCERMNIPPFRAWKLFPGRDRLQRILTLTEECAFAPEGILRWLNRVRPDEAAELREIPLTIERVADATARMFAERAKWWGA